VCCVDIGHGKHVDVILPSEGLVEHFGEESFDVEMLTEFLEYVKN